MKTKMSARARFAAFFLFAMVILQAVPILAVLEAKEFSASFKIVKSLTITKSEHELEFGQVRSDGSSPGTVTVSPFNVRSASGGASLSGSNTLHHRAEFHILGAPNTSYSINLSASGVLHDQGGNNNTLQIIVLRGFSIGSGNENDFSLSGLLDGNGIDTVHVGGTLEVPAGTTFGKYEGGVAISIEY